MKTTDHSLTKKKPFALLLGVPALLIAAFVTFVTFAAADRSYQGDNLEIHSVEVKDDGSIQIAFSPLVETMWYCPGADAKATEKGVELKFVRAGFKKKPKVDYPAKNGSIDGKAVKLITLPKETKAILLREGKELRKIYPSEE
jgi:hypothetical protein